MRKLAAETVGTALLVAAVVGSGIMAERLSGGNAGLALLANTLATGAMLVVLILVFGSVSGAHFNPVVSLVFFLKRELSAAQLARYAIGQVVGGVLGACLAHAMFGLPLVQASSTVRGGPGQWLSEAVAAFGLVVTILGTAHARRDAVPFAVGLYISAAYWFTASTSFANPAVTIARAMSDTFAGIHPASVPAFVLAQVAGGLLALGFCRWLLAPPRTATGSMLTNPTD